MVVIERYKMKGFFRIKFKLKEGIAMEDGFTDAFTDPLVKTTTFLIGIIDRRVNAEEKTSK